MAEPITNNWQYFQWSELNFWNSNSASQKMAEWFAKILWKKEFQKSAIQEHDDQIVEVVREVYLPPEKRKDEDI